MADRGGSKKLHAMIQGTLKHRMVHWIRNNISLFIFGVLCIAWFLFRTGTKPSRIGYPCQQASLAGAHLWFAVYLLPLVSIIRVKGDGYGQTLRILGAGIIIVALIIGALYFFGYLDPNPFPDELMQSDVISDIFVVNGTTGNDGGVDQLIGLMEREGRPFYARENTPSRKGIIARDDTVLIKVNAQWDERGGTNTDLVRSLIQAIINHPDGFTGEIIVADNGQMQNGPTKTGGSLSFTKNNAGDRSQSMEHVVESFSGTHRVSAYLWDSITTHRVLEYAEGDMNDGYIVNETRNPATGILVSYPKFRTRYGTYISFKQGVWDAEKGTY